MNRDSFCSVICGTYFLAIFRSRPRNTSVILRRIYLVQHKCMHNDLESLMPSNLNDNWLVSRGIPSILMHPAIFFGQGRAPLSQPFSSGCGGTPANSKLKQLNGGHPSNHHPPSCCLTSVFKWEPVYPWHSMPLALNDSLAAKKYFLCLETLHFYKFKKSSFLKSVFAPLANNPTLNELKHYFFYLSQTEIPPTDQIDRLRIGRIFNPLLFATV